MATLTAVRPTVKTRVLFDATKHRNTGPFAGRSLKLDLTAAERHRIDAERHAVYLDACRLLPPCEAAVLAGDAAEREYQMVLRERALRRLAELVDDQAWWAAESCRNATDYVVVG